MHIPSFTAWHSHQQSRNSATHLIISRFGVYCFILFLNSMCSMYFSGPFRTVTPVRNNIHKHRPDTLFPPPHGQRVHGMRPNVDRCVFTCSYCKGIEKTEWEEIARPRPVGQRSNSVCVFVVEILRERCRMGPFVFRRVERRDLTMV